VHNRINMSPCTSFNGGRVLPLKEDAAAADPSWRKGQSLGHPNPHFTLPTLGEDLLSTFMFGLVLKSRFSTRPP
jgi:hypothetical protein